MFDNWIRISIRNNPNIWQTFRLKFITYGKLSLALNLAIERFCRSNFRGDSPLICVILKAYLTRLGAIKHNHSVGTYTLSPLGSLESWAAYQSTTELAKQQYATHPCMTLLLGQINTRPISFGSGNLSGKHSLFIR